jgi:hypothetical protein
MIDNIPSYAYDYRAELFLILPHDKMLHHRYITYNQKLKGYPTGFKKGDYSKFNLKAWAQVPISSNEIVDMSIYLSKNNDIEDFTMQYRLTFDKRHLANNGIKIVLPLKEGYIQNDIHTLNIRTDYGHKDITGKIKHTIIDAFDVFNNKINTNGDKSFIKQNFEFYDLASAIGYIFMQAEKINPLIGAQYWLARLGTDQEKVEVTYRLWKDSGVSIPLCILSNNIYVKIIEKINRTKKEISALEFKDVIRDEIQVCKNVENKNSDNIVMHKLHTSTNLFIFPFPFLVPTEGFRYGWFKYDEEGNKHSEDRSADMCM